MRVPVLPALLCAAALVSAPSFARDTSKRPTARGSPSPSTRTPPAAADHDFECALAPADLRPWSAQGLRVPASVKSKFKLWKSVSSAAGLSSAGRSKCRKLPPQAAFVKGPGAGATTRADLVVAQQDVPIYRAYSRAPFNCAFNPPAAELGGWWSLTPPSANKAQYRRATAVCNSWNDFSMKVQCTLKRGTVIAVGSTQSANCSQKPAGCAALPREWARRFGSSPEHQVFINTYRRPQAELETVRQGLSKLMNSLSGHPRVARRVC